MWRYHCSLLKVLSWFLKWEIAVTEIWYASAKRDVGVQPNGKQTVKILMKVVMLLVGMKSAVRLERLSRIQSASWFIRHEPEKMRKDGDTTKGTTKVGASDTWTGDI